MSKNDEKVIKDLRKSILQGGKTTETEENPPHFHREGSLLDFFEKNKNINFSSTAVIRIDPQIQEILRLIKTKTDIGLSDMVNIVLEDLFEKHKKEIKSFKKVNKYLK